MLNRAAFLDRDGTLNLSAASGSYVVAPEQIALFDGAAQAVALLTAAGYRCIVVSNQRGVALGRMSEHDLARVDERLRELLMGAGAALEASYYCTHATGDGCRCRKPEPGLILRAAAERGIDLTRSWMLGDSLTDIEAGRRAGCRARRIEPVGGALLAAAHEVLAARDARQVAS